MFTQEIASGSDEEIDCTHNPEFGREEVWHMKVIIFPEVRYKLSSSLQSSLVTHWNMFLIPD